MNKTLKTVLIVLAVIFVLLTPVISSYNKMITLDQKVKKAESNIDTQLKRRSDLIPNLVETVKGYATQEKEIFTDIANARAKLGGAQSVGQKANADSELSGALGRLLVVVEQYPQLKSNENFRDLTTNLEGTENRINIARQDYNEAVDVYNTSIRRFPASILASVFRFEQREYYKIDESSREVPKVDFNMGK